MAADASHFTGYFVICSKVYSGKDEYLAYKGYVII